MRIKIPCAGCGVEFEPKRDIQIYHNDECRIKTLNELNRVKRNEEIQKFPMYRFPDCEHLIQLDFSPHGKPQLLRNLICKECKKI